VGRHYKRQLVHLCVNNEQKPYLSAAQIKRIITSFPYERQNTKTYKGANNKHLPTQLIMTYQSYSFTVDMPNAA
tara:strand:+ start:600 stop:821 length:222 start_codon:yes stop_codon:yes gene_type:complete